MALNAFELWFNGITIAFFTKQLQKIAQRLGTGPPDPPKAYGGWRLRLQTPVCDTFELR